MPRTSTDKPLLRVCVRLWKDDYEYLGSVADAMGDLSRNELIRTVVHSYVTQMKAKERSKIDAIESAPAELAVFEPN